MPIKADKAKAKAEEAKDHDQAKGHCQVEGQVVAKGQIAGKGQVEAEGQVQAKGHVATKGHIMVNKANKGKFNCFCVIVIISIVRDDDGFVFPFSLTKYSAIFC